LVIGSKTLDCSYSGTTQMSHLMDNIGGENVKLSSTEWKAFNEELNTIQVFGERFPPFVQAMSGVKHL
jgi:hypothetical protein